jgi:hypothetical protein
MEQEKLDEKTQEMLLEQYKLYVSMADNISARRSQTNAFYITVLSVVLTILSLSAEKFTNDLQYVALFIVSILGLILCYVWSINIRSYRQLNSGKFKVIHEMEKQLPFACYSREWKILEQGENAKKYIQLTRIEYYIPYILAIPYIFLLIFVLLSF